MPAADCTLALLKRGSYLTNEPGIVELFREFVRVYDVRIKPLRAYSCFAFSSLEERRHWTFGFASQSEY
jgi:hypothetical protein